MESASADGTLGKGSLTAAPCRGAVKPTVEPDGTQETADASGRMSARLTFLDTLCRLPTMSKDIRITGPMLKVIGQILAAPDSGISGAEIFKSTDVASGTLYPILFRLEKAGWVSSEWEEGDPSELGRPRKRIYRLTGTGARECKLAFKGLVPNGRLAWLS